MELFLIEITEPPFLEDGKVANPNSPSKDILDKLAEDLTEAIKSQKPVTVPFGARISTLMLDSLEDDEDDDSDEDSDEDEE